MVHRKIYYMDELVNCLKFTFSREKSEDSFESIDESTILFKRRSTMKQRMPSKPIKDGIKIWQRSDAQRGYSNDYNIYHGKETNIGERVVQKLYSIIHETDVSIYKDRFFTTVNLMKTFFMCRDLPNRKNLPIMSRL